MALHLTVPTHLDGRNPIVGRNTARELVPLVVGIFAAAGLLGQPHLLSPARIGEALAIALLGSVLGLIRPGGRSLMAWGRCVATHLLGERVSAWAPPALYASTASAGASIRPPHLTHIPGVPSAPSIPSRPPRNAPRPIRLPATPAHPVVPVEIAAGTVVFGDGRRCAILECSGATVVGMDVEEQRALHAAYHAFVRGLSFPVQILVCADPVDLGPYAARRTERLAGHPLAVRRLGSADAAYMRRALTHLGALDQRVYVVISETAGLAPPLEGTGPLALLRSRQRRAAAEQDGAAVSRLLTDRCTAIQEGLSQAGVHAWRLDTPALQQLYYRRLCPRTARLQPFDRGHAAPVATGPVFVDQASPIPYDEAKEGDDAADDV